MLWLYKTKNWIVAHKNWLVLVGLFILSYVLGKRSNQNYLEMANLAKDQYKKENEELERLQKAKEKRDKTIEQNTKVITKSLKEERDKKIKELEKEHTAPDEVFQNIGIKKK
jgi:hypothetical protein